MFFMLLVIFVAKTVTDWMQNNHPTSGLAETVSCFAGRCRLIAAVVLVLNLAPWLRDWLSNL